MIHVIDYKVGNIGSVVNMLNYLGTEVTIASTPDDLKDANKIILPGVGAFDAGATALTRLGFDSAIKTALSERGVTLLGICLGMQLLMENSEEGSCQGLGLIKGSVKKIALGSDKLRIPHMGWNTVDVKKKNRLIQSDLKVKSRYYFVHSYCVHCEDKEDIAGMTSYGESFTSVLEKGNILGVQFHPEKSHTFGKELFRNFLAV